jgi:hypothetical protein
MRSLLLLALVAAGLASAAPAPGSVLQPPLDSDGDGKPDDVDDCPGRHGQTPSGCPDSYPPDDTPPSLSGTPRAVLDGQVLRVTLGRFSEDVRGRVVVLGIAKRFKARPQRTRTLSFRLEPDRVTALRERERVRLKVRVRAKDPAGHSMSRTLRPVLRP